MQVVMCRLIIAASQQLDQIVRPHTCPAQQTFQMQAGIGVQARQGKKRVKQLPYLNECNKSKWFG